MEQMAFLISLVVLLPLLAYRCRRWGFLAPLAWILGTIAFLANRHDVPLPLISSERVQAFYSSIVNLDGMSSADIAEFLSGSFLELGLGLTFVIAACAVPKRKQPASGGGSHPAN